MVDHPPLILFSVFSPQVKQVLKLSEIIYQFESKLVNLIEADCLTALVKHQVHSHDLFHNI